jgi:hypothetical protein
MPDLLSQVQIEGTKPPTVDYRHGCLLRRIIKARSHLERLLAPNF